MDPAATAVAPEPPPSIRRNVTRPTQRTYTTLQAAYDHFNRTLFGNELPSCLITYTRHKGALGYYSPERMQGLDDLDVVDEIALNPCHFHERGVMRTLSTLVHEMVHCWQQHIGNAPRRCYHDREFALKMEQVGLHTTEDGTPSGKRVGEKMTHLIIKGGPFEKYATSFIGSKKGGDLYQDLAAIRRAADKKQKKKSKVKYTCPGCGLNAWAKPASPLGCLDCNVALVAEDEGEDDDD